MADESGRVHWLSPDPRAIIELGQLKVSRSLRTVLRRAKFDFRVNTAFEEVLFACANRPDGTWISREIGVAYSLLHDLGYAHSVEAWRGDHLEGGLYGVAIGGAFFGESMFSLIPDSSKVALVSLVKQLKAKKFTLLDIQFMTSHLAGFGAIEIQRSAYMISLTKALRSKTTFV